MFCQREECPLLVTTDTTDITAQCSQLVSISTDHTHLLSSETHLRLRLRALEG